MFDSASQWVRFAQNKTNATKVSCKAQILYKGKRLREWEPTLSASAFDVRDVLEDASEQGEAGAEEASGGLLDMERRRRELEAASRRAEKGLRLEPLGHDRLLRSYWSFPGAPDTVWVCAAAPCGGRERFSTNEITGDGKRDVWRRFCAADGSLAGLVEYLEQGPRGPLESLLLPMIQKLNSRAAATTGSRDRSAVTDAGYAGAAVAGKERADGCEVFEWTELPEIGDVVWARVKGEGKGGASGGWQPVTLVDAQADDAAEDSGEEAGGGVHAEDDDDEWHTSGNDYIGKRVQVLIRDARSGAEFKEAGRVFGWLPAEEADFKSEETGELAALWRVKFDDGNVTSQDLEEHEVQAAMRAFAKAQAARRSEQSAYLSQATLFGQRVRWVHGRRFDGRAGVETFPLAEVRPYLQFRDERVRELEAAGARRVLRAVQQADRYLEERREAAQSCGDPVQEALAELGLGMLRGTELTPEMRAACLSCMRTPRVMAVVKQGREQAGKEKAGKGRAGKGRAGEEKLGEEKAGERVGDEGVVEAEVGAAKVGEAGCSAEDLRAQLLAIFDAMKVRSRRW